MRILLVNPNSTASMTRKIGDAARAVAAAGTVVVAVNPPDTPPSIEGYYDEALSLAGLLAEVRKGEAEGFDGFVVACFDDSGLDACRSLATGPVVGICEAAMHLATTIATGFSVVTTLPRSIPIIEHNALRYGFERQCRRVRAADVPVLALEQPGSDARQKVRSEIMRAIEEDRCEAVILGCAGMADLTNWLSEETGIPVIDGVVAAAKLVEAIVGAGLRTGKTGGYAPPLPK